MISRHIRNAASRKPRTASTKGGSPQICWPRTFPLRRPIKSGRRIYPISGPPRVGFISQKGLAVTALRKALAMRQFSEGLIHHSDRGSQYASDDYQRLLASHRIAQSMSEKGNCYDNAMMESVFKTIKSEMIWRISWQSRFEP